DAGTGVRLEQQADHHGTDAVVVTAYAQQQVQLPGRELPQGVQVEVNVTAAQSPEVRLAGRGYGRPPEVHEPCEGSSELPDLPHDELLFEHLVILSPGPYTLWLPRLYRRRRHPPA